nr:GGDEF domain-containing protein [Evansella sp. LMS18]
MEKKAYHDSLTELFNRSFLEENFTYIIEKGALFLIDLDGFKEVNDTYGHDTGDNILKEASSRIESCLDSSEIAVRLGGDEFVILVPGVVEDNKLKDKGEQLIYCLSDWKNSRLEINISASVGIAKYPEHANDLSSLLKAADTAMYAAKRDGGSQLHFQYK